NNLHNLALAALNHHDAQSYFPVDEDYYESGPFDFDTSNLSNLVNTQYQAVDDPLRKQRKLSGAGWIVQVLPQLEQQALHDRFKPYLDSPWMRQKLGMNANVPQLRAAIQTQPEVLMCPSNDLQGPRDDQFPYSSSTEAAGAPVLVAVTHYKGNSG